ncbi:MAG: tetratricopeptide repeat protein [bacterium]|nr:tetratricopeptide repeat protein [bacterium]
MAEIELASGTSSAAVALLDRVEVGSEGAGGAAYRAVQIRRDAGAGAPEIEQRLVAILDSDPRHAAAALELAHLIAERDPDSEQALMLARRSALLGGGSRAVETVGRLLVQRGEWEAAVRILKPLIASLPDASVAEYWTARAYERLGDPAAARASYERALSSAGLDLPQIEYSTSALGRLSDDPPTRAKN